MQQIVLDPNDTSVAKPSETDHRVPARVRRFGYVPDTSILLPGDVILICATKPAWTSRLIQTTQEAGGGYAPDHARWHHVAVYIGNGHVVEALTSGVIYRKVDTYSGNWRLRFRRGPDLTQDQRYEIAIQSMTRLRERYSLWALPRVGFNLMRTIARPTEPIRGVRAVICSQVYWDAYLFATHRNPTPGVISDVSPAAISASEILSDITVGWIRLMA